MKGFSKTTVGLGVLTLALATALVMTLASKSPAQSSRDEVYAVYGAVGVAKGQFVRLNLTNVAADGCLVEMRFVGADGRIVNRTKSRLAPDRSESLEYMPPLTDGQVMKLRAVFISVGDSCSALLPQFEIVDGHTRKTEVVVASGDPIA